LPSSFTEAQREAYGLVALAKQEAELRIGNAHDYLSGLRDALGLRSLLVQAKKTHIRGQIKTTRAEASIERAAKVVQRQEAGYKRNWRAMGILDVKTSLGQPGYGLQELQEGDIKGLQSFIENPQYNGDPAQLPWIWRSFGGSAPTTASTSEVQKLTWVHSQASRDRWWEEHVLLRAESERVVLAFRHAAREWRAVQPSAELPSEVQRGIRAYGQKKGAMYEELTKEAAVFQALVNKHWSVTLEKQARAALAEIEESSEHMAAEPIIFEDADDLY
ncbi:hypothetical protein M407DRAFT_85990, partial [Tulasnella calospora MUT 4182]